VTCTWAYTLRLDPELAADLETVASVDGVSIVDAVRTAITAHLERKHREASTRV
jgi:hypothetical protein